MFFICIFIDPHHPPELITLLCVGIAMPVSLPVCANCRETLLLLLLCASLAVPSGFSQIKLCQTFPFSLPAASSHTHPLPSLSFSGFPSLAFTYINPDSPIPSLNPLLLPHIRSLSPFIFLSLSPHCGSVHHSLWSTMGMEDDF